MDSKAFKLLVEHFRILGFWQKFVGDDDFWSFDFGFMKDVDNGDLIYWMIIQHLN